jgi:hydrogenase maturation protease
VSGALDTSPPASVAVIGLGNVLLGDDGFGPTVIALLRAGWEFPADVELIDGGTPGLHLVASVHGRDALVLIDAVAGAGAPGELRRYRREDLERLPILARVSPHDPAVLETLAIADLAGRGPQTVLVVGVIPASLAMETTLSPPVRAACPGAAALVVEELTRLGVPPRTRRETTPPDAWWLRPALENP